jgi:hypothetical protein
MHVDENFEFRLTQMKAFVHQPIHRPIGQLMCLCYRLYDLCMMGNNVS